MSTVLWWQSLREALAGFVSEEVITSELLDALARYGYRISFAYMFM
jgi:hypothetical protein